MMAAVVQCPNPACGKVSHLGEDPLGRIFRCPRCRTKLPAVPSSASDSGWTAVLGVPRLGLGASRARLSAKWAQPAAALAGWTAATTCSAAFESGEVMVGDLDSRDGESGYSSHPGLGPDDSGEVCIDPFSQSGGSAMGWGSVTTSSMSVPQAVRTTLGLSSAELEPAKQSELGRFRIVAPLGEGQHAIVYRAYDPILERDVALKIPRRGVLKTAKMLARFLAEAKALAKLRHPQIVPVYEAGCAGGRHYIAMGLIEGRSLADELAKGPLEVRRAAEIVADLAEALDYAHAQGVVHRDVKPANIRLDDQGVAYLMDFGIAYHPDSGEVPLPPGTILGTPAYVAPEQAQTGQTHVLPASDQYSLGVVLYELLSGQPPFSGPPSYVLFHAIHHEPPSLHTNTPGISRSLAAICSKALSKSPEDRYAGCQHFAHDLRRWLRGENPQAYRRAWSRLRG